MSKKYFVYALFDPIFKQPFYIGKGSGDRPYAHLRGHDKFNEDKHTRIALIRTLGGEPQVWKFDAQSEEEAYHLETCLIDECRRRGYQIANVTGVKKPPSRKGSKATSETKEKISESLRRAWATNPRPPVSEETRLRQSLSHRGKPSARKIPLTKEILENQLNTGFPIYKIAENLNVSNDTIKRRMNEYGLRKPSKRKHA